MYGFGQNSVDLAGAGPNTALDEPPQATGFTTHLCDLFVVGIDQVTSQQVGQRQLQQDQDQSQYPGCPVRGQHKTVQANPRIVITKAIVSASCRWHLNKNAPIWTRFHN